MIRGIGIDMVSIARMERLCANPAFLPRFFSQAELALFETKGNTAQTIAANFAAKEAFSKALGTGVRGFWLRDIGFVRGRTGAPEMEKNETYRRLGTQFGFHCVHVSLTHEGDTAAAVVILEQ